ncbi:MAG: T9SS type A sorting domain-containing protein [Flavipsychrobacter sp.]|nr:T9SS type A sorting domain-containing protein [Flavipsychrobacter sp.]
MKKLLPFFIIFLSLSAGAQNWNPLRPGVNNYFTNVHNYLLGMRIDSVIGQGADIHYYPFRSLRGDFFNFTDSGSWLGKDIIRRSNGTFLFPNRWGDTIAVKTLAAVGDTWQFFHDSTPVYYNAEVVAADTMTILGVADSIKTIRLTAYDNGVPLLTDSFNNAELVLSKGHGFYKTMHLYLFPFHSPDSTGMDYDLYFYHSLLSDSMASFNYPVSAGPAAGIFTLANYIVPTGTVLTNWNVGDVREYSICANYTWFGCDPPTSYKLDTVISKTITSDTVSYATNGWWADFTNVLQQYFYTMEPYQDSFKINDNPYWAHSSAVMPEEFNNVYVNMAYYPFRYYVEKDTSFCMESPKYSVRATYWFNSMSVTHKAGLGQVQFHSQGYDGQVAEIRDTTLIYYKHNGQSCGSFVMPDTVAPVSVASQGQPLFVKVYPNPVTDILNVELSANAYDIILCNSLGQQVFKRTGCTARQQIDLTYFSPGIYHLQMITEDKATLHHKVVRH